MKVEFRGRKVMENWPKMGRSMIFKVGDVADLPANVAERLCRQHRARPYEAASVASPSLSAVAPGLACSQETAALPNTREMATKPKPKGKTKPADIE